MNELRKLTMSFSYAGRGILWAVRTQRNLRIHLTAMAAVLYLAWLERLSGTELCLELLCCMAVISLELMNSALEQVCDAVTLERRPRIRNAKDAAAGAVLASAIGSAAVALVILFAGGHWGTLCGQLRERRWTGPVLLLILLLGAGFVFLPCMRSHTKDQKK